MKTYPLAVVTAWLDNELAAPHLSDSSHNGLQVANAGKVSKVCTGVDATGEFFREAWQRGANLLIVHHGLSWGDSLKRITDLNYRGLKFLLDHDMALYASHLPLDAHPDLGNNAQLCRALEIHELDGFGTYGGGSIGFRGAFREPLALDALARRVEDVTGHTPQVMPHGSARVKTAGVVSGGAGDMVAEAARANLDVFISGEPTLQAWNQSREYGINAVFAGHYATEIGGPRALGKALAKQFAIPVECIDMRVRY